MKYFEAKTEFGIRLYRWAKLSQEKEIKESFPGFRAFRGQPKKTCHYFQSLDQAGQQLLAQGLLQSRHEEAVKAVGETISDEVKIALRRYEDYSYRYTPGFGEGEDLKYAKRREVRKAMKMHFQTAFGKSCLPADPHDKPDLVFGTKCCGWTIKTWFDFGRWYPEISCEHTIWTGRWITPDQPEVIPGNYLWTQLSYGREIGIGSNWEYLTDGDVEPSCLAVVEHCRHIFNALPELLKGIELESLIKPERCN